MNDPLSRALEEAPERCTDHVPDVVERHTSHPHEVRDILDDVTKQARAVVALPFFDAGTDDDRTPIIKVGLAEAGTTHISARHAEPPYCVDLTLYVRSDVEATDTANYEVRARCEISCETEHPPLQREFAIGITVAEDGAVVIDAAQLQAAMADAIRSFGKQSLGAKNIAWPQ